MCLGDLVVDSYPGSCDGLGACGQAVARYNALSSEDTVTEPPEKESEIGNALEAEPVGPLDGEPPAHQLLFHQVADCFTCKIR